MLTDLSGPTIDFAGMARANGVPASTASSAEAMTQRLQEDLSERAPHLLELVL